MSATQVPQRTVYDAPDLAFEPAPSRPPVPAEEPRRAGWSAAKRVGFRFLFTYFVLYLFPFPLSHLPIPGNPTRRWGQAKQWLGLWTETHIFGLDKPVPIIQTGSGDTMVQWASQVNWLLLALGVTLAWTSLDRKRREYTRLDEWLRVYVRFGLATIMFGYGFAKIVPTQMPAPQLERLVEPFGEFSPMGVLWTFMGVSAVYQIFTGIGEALGSLLLVFRRTATLGALLLCAVLANVVLLNYTFDVPVKLLSTNLLLMAIFIAAPDAKRLFGVLVLNHGVQPREMRPLFSSVRMRRVASIIVTLFVAVTMFAGVSRGLRYYLQLVGPDAPKSPLYGIWDVESLTKNAVEQPPLLSDSTRLKRAVFGGLDRATFRLMSDSVERYTLSVDSTRHEITLAKWFGPGIAQTMSYVKPDAEHLVLAGQVGRDSVIVRLRRFDEKRFLLINRGYHWVQEQPYNR